MKFDELLNQCEDEYIEFRDAFYNFMKNPSEKNKLALLFEIGDCINQLSFISATICGAEKLIR